MLGWILTVMAYDVARTANNNLKEKEAEKEKQKKIKHLQWRLKRPMTRSHTYQCRCRLCHNRRTDAINQLNSLLGVK
jgi:hypothetical protein